MNKGQKNQSVKLSHSGRLAVAVGIALAAPYAFSQGIQPIGATSLGQQNGVDIVNIAAPNAQGLSHNQYRNYNVSPSGAVLNNALAAGESQLAGALGANPHLHQQAASVILNEVISNNPSLILGSQEVFGMAADYLLANPNGIHYQGGKLINMPHAGFLVGKAEIEDGKLGLLRTDTQNALQISGGDFSDTAVLNLIAPKVRINAHLQNKEAINVITGHNDVRLQDNAAPLVQAHSDNAAPMLDGALYGSMHSGKIRIHATNERAYQSLRGTRLSADDEINLNIAGKLAADGVDLQAQSIVLDGKDAHIGGLAKTTSQTSGDEQASKTIESRTISDSRIKADRLSFNHSGELSLSATHLEADQLDMQAANLHFLSQTAKQTVETQQQQSKGLWFDKQHTIESSETTHGNHFNIAHTAHIHAQNDIHANALQLQLGDKSQAAIRAGGHLWMDGAVAHQSLESEHQFKNASGKLKTGHEYTHEHQQIFSGSSIEAGEDSQLVLQAGKSITLTGSSIQAHHLITDAERLNIRAARSNDYRDESQQARYLGGANAHREQLNDESVHASSIQLSGQGLLAAKNGVSISGSTIEAQEESFIHAGKGKLSINGVVEQDSRRLHQRIGTVLNITKSEHQQDSQTQSAANAVVQSASNLRLISGDDVELNGAMVKAAQTLGINSAGDLNISTLALRSQSSSSDLALSGKPDFAGDIQKAQASAGAGIGIHQSGSRKDNLQHSGSSLQGAAIDLNADSLKAQGAKLKADGDITVNAGNASFTAAQDTQTLSESKRDTNIGLSLNAQFNKDNPRLDVNLGADSAFSQTDTHSSKAQVSEINGGNIYLNVNKDLSHQGTALNAEGEIRQTADTIRQTAAADRRETTTVEHQGGAKLNFGIDSKKALNGGVVLNGKGGKATESSSTAVLSRLQAGGDIQHSAQQEATDVGTHYQAGGKVAIAVAQGDYRHQAASNTVGKTNNHGGGSIALSAATKDMQTVDVNLNVGVNFQHEHSDGSTAVKGLLQGAAVEVSANKADIASDIAATGTVKVMTQNGATFSQSQNTANSQSGGFALSSDVGAKVIPAATAAVPSIGVSAEVNYGDSHSSQGVGAQIVSGDSVVINGGSHVKLDGASIAAANAVDVEGAQIDSHALSNRDQSIAVGVGGKVKIGASLSDAAFGAHLDVAHQDRLNHSANTISAKNVNLSAHSESATGLALSGTQIVGKETHLANTQGGISLGSESGHRHKTGVGLGFNIAAKIDGAALQPSSGDARLSIDIARNTEHSGSNVLTDSGTLNSKGDLALTDSSITANRLGGEINGDIHILANQDLTKQFALNLAASGGGKAATITEKPAAAAAEPAAAEPQAVNPLIEAGGKVIAAAQQADQLTQALKPIISNAQAGTVDKGQIDKAITTAIGTAAAYAPDDSAKQVLNHAQQLANINSAVTPIIKDAANGSVKPADILNLSKQGLNEAALLAGDSEAGKAIAALQQGNHLAQAVEPVVSALVNDKPVSADAVAGLLNQGLDAADSAFKPTSNVIDVLKEDVKNGTILGVKAQAEAGIAIEHSAVSQQAGLQVANLETQIKGGLYNQGGSIRYDAGKGADKVILNAANQDHRFSLDVGGKLSTNVPEMIAQGIKHAQSGTSELGHAELDFARQNVGGNITTP